MHAVFLQGMPSPFFSRIADALSARGCKATGITLCAGDALFWKGPHTVPYRGRRADWPGFIGAFFEAQAVTDLVLLGEQRDYHKETIAVAKQRGVRVTVTDFGYLRPDWITLERDGMSANSLFPKNAEAIAALAAGVPEPDLERRYRDSSKTMSVNDVVYSFSNVLLWFLYPHYRRSDRRPHPIRYFPRMGWRLLWAARRDEEARAYVRSFLESRPRYFVFPLQLEHDFQLVAYSPFGRMEEAIRMVVASFAGHAQKGMQLVVKAHPWDPGFTNWRKVLSALAAEYGVSGKVHYVDGGDLAEMIRGALGMVTINSTSGVQALQLGCPVKLLGEAIYDVPGLVYAGSLDSYWQGAMPPDAKLVDQFIRAMASTIQIRGVFFSEPGLGNAVQEAVERIYHQRVGLAP